MNTTIYYFSGTGNSLKIAKDLANLIPDTTLIRISKESVNSITAPPEGKVGFVFPVYFYGLPNLVREFIERLPIKENTYVFTVANYGGSLGATRKQIIRVLAKKKVTLAAGYGLLMPDNYIIMYPPMAREKQEAILSKEITEVKDIAQEIINGKSKTFTEKGRYFTKLIGPAASAVFHPNKMDRNFWTDQNCNGCETCFKLCPVDNIIMTEGKPEWRHQCELCLSCIQCCPRKAIQYKKGTMAIGRYHNPEIKLSELYLK